MSRDKVVVGRTLAEDEVDFDSGFVMVPAAVPEAAAIPAPGSTPGGSLVPGLGPGVPTPAGPTVTAPTPPSMPEGGRQNVVRLKFKATRDQVFKAFPAIANLADKSDDSKVTVNVKGSSSEGFDPSWLRNAVEEPLDEADIERMPEGDSEQK